MKSDVRSNIRQWRLMLVCGAVLLAAPAARADRAVVVGVNTYPGLTNADLNGCVPDAKLMSDTLKKLKFEVTLLTDNTATKQGILDALAAAKTANQQRERFVFYFAGHGTRASNGNSVLLPHDSEEKSEEHDIKSDELYTQLNSIPARTRTVLLDSCFSGGMSRSVQNLKRKNLKTRSYVRKRIASRDLNPPQDTMTDAATGNVCYFTATRKNEQAGEDLFPNGERHGVFTYYLVQRLNSDKDIWGNVQAKVGSQVSSWMDDTQHPTLSPSYNDAQIFEARVAPSDTTPNPPDNPTPPNPTPVVTPAPKPNTMWETYSADNADPEKVLVSIEPDQTTFAVGEQLTFSVKLGAPGYLVLLERGTSGKVNLLFPADARVETAERAAGWTMTIPEDKGMAWAPDQPGTERIKALLFTSKEKAEAVLEKFRDKDGKARSLTRNAMSRDLVLVAKKPPVQNNTPDTPPSKINPVLDFYSSDIIFEIVPAGTEGNK